MGEACSANGGGSHIGYWWKSQQERPLGRPKHKWVDNIKMDLVQDWSGSG
jgi:hypothetical protein